MKTRKAAMPRYELAKREAEALIAQHNVRKAPVPVEALAESLGAVVRREPFSGEQRLSGLIRRTRNGGAVIGVNSLDAPVRQRFTIAHELGHFLLHDLDLHVDRDFPVRFRDHRSSTAADIAEIEANQFAQHLLMPAKLLNNDLLKLDPFDVDDDEQIEALARKYDVSVRAMSLRIAKLVDYSV